MKEKFEIIYVLKHAEKLNKISIQDLMALILEINLFLMGFKTEN